MEKYDHKKIEKKWQKKWQDEKPHAASDDSSAEKYYLLVEFPYPSGNLHVGHWYAFSVPDIYARYLRMTGKNVLYPIGFDAFGLPAENAAIKRGLNPREWTYDNMAHMRDQIRSMGASFDWSREVVTCDPKYYKWTQWQFIELFKRGLVYRKETAVNWCPNDKTVLANEQVVGGKCERCGAGVEQRLMPQWNIKITDYADRLIDDLAPLNWPEQIKDSQRNWIGRSEGAEIDFELTSGEKLTVFTTRPDTLFGATYMVIAPEHALVQASQDADVRAYIEQAKRKTELERQENKEKTGVKLKGVKAINPATKGEIPIFVADYVLGGYGTGAIMAVPAHDERDFEFAQKFGLPIVPVIKPVTGTPQENPEHRKSIVALVIDRKKDRVLTINWGEMGGRLFIGGGQNDGEDVVSTATREIAEETGYTDLKCIAKTQPIQHNYFAHSKNVARQIDAVGLLFELQSEQKINQKLEADEQGKFSVEWVPLSQVEQVKDELHRTVFGLLVGQKPYSDSGLLINSGQFDGMDSEEAKQAITEFVGGRMAKQYRLRDWVVSRQRYWGVPIPMIHCEKCDWQPVPETELPVALPEIEDYLPTGDGKSPLAKVTSFIETTCPKCGRKATRETDTLDTFVDSSWYFLRYSDPHNDQAFADKQKIGRWMPVDLYSGGSEHTTMHVLYSRFWHKALFDAGLVTTSEPYTRRMNRGLIMGPDGQKMSKSKGNVIDPDEVVANLGADTVRMYLSFIGPYNEVGSYPWNPNGAVGVRRFLERVWNMQEKVQDVAMNSETEQLLNQTIGKVGADIGSLKMNTAVSALMVLSNHLHELDVVPKAAYEVLLTLLLPFAPHIGSELFERLGTTPGAWPAFDPAKAASKSATVAVQINGKVRATLELPPELSQEAALSAARADATVGKWLAEGREIKAIYVPGKVINFVIGT